MHHNWFADCKDDFDEHRHGDLADAVADAYRDDLDRAWFAAVFVCAVEAHLFGRPDHSDDSPPRMHLIVREHLQDPRTQGWVLDLLSRYPDRPRRQVVDWLTAGCPNTLDSESPQSRYPPQS